MKIFKLALALATVLAALHATPAAAAVAGRLYIKQSGTITFALDTGGNVYARGGNRGGVSASDTGLQFKQSGTPFAAIRNASASDRHQLGSVTLGNAGIYENFSSVPFRTSGTLVFFYRATPTATKTGMLEIDHNDGSFDVRGNYDSRFAYRQSTLNLKPSERANLIAAWLCTDTHYFPGTSGPNEADPNSVGGVSWWDKQWQTHYSFGEHTMDSNFRNPAFLPWHREFIARFETLLRSCDPLVSLAYWDWTQDPLTPSNYDGVPLVTDNSDPAVTKPAGWFGNVVAGIGAPFMSLYSDDGIDGNDRDHTLNPADPPELVWRHVNYGGPPPDDATVLSGSNFEMFTYDLESAHGDAHGCWSGSMNDLKTSPEDPAFFLVHGNVDRLWAVWQRTPGMDWRIAGDLVYGDYSMNWPNNWPLQPARNPDQPLQMYMGTPQVDPWAGGPGYMGYDTPLRPWASPDTQQAVHDYNDPALTTPTLYEMPDGLSVL